MKPIFRLLIAVIFLSPIAAGATLIGDTVNVNVETGSGNGDVLVTLGAGPEVTISSTENSPDEGISFDFEDFYVDIVLADYQGGFWLWKDLGTTFNITMSNIGPSEKLFRIMFTINPHSL